MNTFQAKFLAEKLTLKKSGGSLSRLGNVLAKATIDLNPHQVYAALYAFNSPLSRGAILADEVGLGKTIEAGLIISQLWAEGKHRILILTPASLRTQWQDELFTKFGLESEIWDGPSFQKTISDGNAVPLTYEGIFIVSYNFAYANLGIVRKQLWNVVTIDEAHRFRRVYRGRDASKMAFEIREAIKDRPKVLLTATPLQNSLEELYGIASFIDDKLLGSVYSFRKKFIQPIRDKQDVAGKRIEQLKKLINGSGPDDKEQLSGIITRTLRKQVGDYVKFTDRHSRAFDFSPTEEEQDLYEKVSDYLKRERLAAISHTQRNLMILVYRKLLASSSFAISGTLQKLISNLEKELDIRKESGGSAVVEPVADMGLNDEFEDSELESLEHKTISKIDESFTDEEIRRELSELKEYHELAISIKENTKGTELIFALKEIFETASKNGWPIKAVVFTESTRTQKYLVSLLQKNSITFTEFNGANNSEKARHTYRKWAKRFPEAASKGSINANVRQALVNEFKTETQVFLTTEAGAEGLNLQFCNVVINYDLPWNPQRVEQRIGRCHRYGQQYEVIVANFLNTKNYADKRVYELLNDKLKLFDGLFGSSDEILGALENGIDFERTIAEIYQNCRTPEEYDTAFSALQESLSGKIENDILKYRKLLLESTDQAVTELFKRTAAESKQILEEADKDLLRLCVIYFGGDMTYNKAGDHYFIRNYEFPLVFRSLHEVEEGHKTRAATDLPIINNAIVESLAINTNPIPSAIFPRNNIAALRDTQEGFIFLWKLTIKGVEDEEELVPFAYKKIGDEYQPIDIGAADELISIDSKPLESGIGELPIDYSDLMAHWEEWKKPVIDKYKKRNERLHDREVDRLNSYYDEYSLQIDEKIKKYEDERADLSRRRDNSADLDERRKLQKRMMDVEEQLDKQRILQLKAKTEAAEKRKEDLDELWRKLEPTFNEELIAITHFMIDN